MVDLSTVFRNFRGSGRCRYPMFRSKAIYCSQRNVSAFAFSKYRISPRGVNRATTAEMGRASFTYRRRILDVLPLPAPTYRQESAGITCGGSGFACIDPGAPCVDEDDFTVESCSDIDAVGNGKCDDGNNKPDCGTYVVR